MANPRPSPPLVRAARTLALACLATSVALACGDDPNRTGSSAATAGLVVLSGQPAEPVLTTFDVRGQTRSLALPSAPVAWISAGRRGTLIATTTDGGLQLSDRVTPDAEVEIAWHVVPGPDTDLPEEPLRFGTWSANGLRVAALAADFDTRQSLAIVDPVGDSSLIIAIDGQVLPQPPAWIDEQRVGVPRPQGLAVVDTSTGETAEGPPAVRVFTVSADGSTVAVETPGGGEVEIRTTAEWLARRGSPQARIDGDGDAGTLAFDRLGDRLAVVWERANGPGVIVVYRSEGGWREIGRSRLPGGAEQGTVSWLP
jgi:hypothetical protein